MVLLFFFKDAMGMSLPVHLPINRVRHPTPRSPLTPLQQSPDQREKKSPLFKPYQHGYCIEYSLSFMLLQCDGYTPGPCIRTRHKGAVAAGKWPADWRSSRLWEKPATRLSEAGSHINLHCSTGQRQKDQKEASEREKVANGRLVTGQVLLAATGLRGDISRLCVTN